MKKYLILLIIFVLSLLLIIIASCSKPQPSSPSPETTVAQTEKPETTTHSPTSDPMPQTDPVTDAVTTEEPEITVPVTAVPETAAPPPKGSLADYKNKGLHPENPWSAFNEEFSNFPDQLLKYRDKEWYDWAAKNGIDFSNDEWRSNLTDDLPYVYHFIRVCGIPKEEFIAAMDAEKDSPSYYDYVYISREAIDILYSGDEDLIRRKLHTNNTFYYEGKIYNLNALSGCDDATLTEMCERGELKEYVERMAGYFEDGYWPDWRVYMDPNNHTHICGGIIPKLLDRIANLT